MPQPPASLENVRGRLLQGQDLVRVGHAGSSAILLRCQADSLERQTCATP